MTVLSARVEPWGCWCEGAGNRPEIRQWCTSPRSSGWVGRAPFSAEPGLVVPVALGQAGSSLGAGKGLPPEELHVHGCVHAHTHGHTGIIVAVRGDGNIGIYRDLSPGGCLVHFHSSGCGAAV